MVVVTPSVPERPSYEELVARNVELLVMVAELRDALVGAYGRIADLEARLKMDSSNSSKPPSSDNLFTKPEPKSLRERSEQKSGGQKGHTGTSLRQRLEPDITVVHRPSACGSCGSGLVDAVVTGIERRQVIDIPEPVVTVTEYQLVSVLCACGHETRGGQDVPAKAPVSYGSRVSALVAYLYHSQYLSMSRTAQACDEMFGLPLSGGTVAAMVKRMAAFVRTSGILEHIRAAVAGAPVAHFDETGLRVEASLYWVHSASTSKFSLFTAHPKRGRIAMDQAGVLPEFSGVAVHDAWAPYDCYSQAVHALCNAHLQRELVAARDQQEKLRPEQWSWAGQALDALLKLKTAADQARADGQVEGAQEAMSTQIRRLRDAAKIGADEPGSSAIARKHRALARRIRDRNDDYLRFLDQELSVPWDNNAAEREVRMIKLRQKVSGGLRTAQGATDFADLRSYTATAAKHGIAPLEALRALAERRPILPMFGLS